MRVSATAKYIGRSTRKTRLVTRAIVGRKVEDAAAILRFMPQGAAKDVAKVLKSATANAENNLNRSADELIVADAIAKLRRAREGGIHTIVDPTALGIGRNVGAVY